MSNENPSTRLAQSVNHVGITVTDINQGIAFYRDALGYRLIAGPLDIVPDQSHFGQLAKDILGERLKRGQFAHLVGANGVGLELFAFDDAEAGPRDAMEFWKNGFYHIALSTDDIDAAIDWIEQNGGRRRTATWEIFPGAGRHLAYAEDPFGNPLELYDHDYEDTWALAAQDEREKAGDPVTLVVELTAKPETRDEVAALTRAVMPKAMDEPTGRSIELMEDRADPSKIMLIEKWGSKAYVTSDAHLKSNHMQEYFAALQPLLAEPPRWSVWSLAERIGAR